MRKIVEVENLTKKYYSRGQTYNVLKGISFEVIENEYIAIMGPSGSGKTTLLNVMSTIDKYNTGKISINGVEISKLNKNDLSKFRVHNIGFVFQEYNLLDNMSVKDNIALPLILNNFRPNEIIEKVNKVSKSLNIYDQLEKYPYELSGGQKQRVAISRALISSPSIIFADEPTGSLDSKSTEEILYTFKRIKNEYGTTIIMVTHDPYAASFCDRVLFLNDGLLVKNLTGNTNHDLMYQQILKELANKGAE